jgi:zinc protease
VILALTPEKSGVTPPTAAQLRASLDSVARVAVTPWADTSVNRALIERMPTPGTVASRRELPELGITVVKFSNGLEAWLKPTDFKNDQILFSMYAMGGASVAPQADFVQASMATRYVGLSGYGGLSATDLPKILSGKRISVSPGIGLSSHSISGSAAPADLESALQLLYTEFTSPNSDPQAFALMKRQLEAAVANRGQAPGQVYGERLDAINTSNHYTSQPLTAEVVASLDAAKMLAFYKARFGNAADFTMFMVGAFQVDQALPLLARYVGSLPSTGAKTAQFKDLGIKFPGQIVRETVRKGREPVARTVMSFFADLPPDALEQEKAQAATFVFETTLREVLREDLGQTYTVSVGLAQSYPQRGAGHVQVSFNADPANIDGMVDRVIDEMKKLQERGPAAPLVDKAKESARRAYEESLKENGYWLGRMQRVHMIGADPKEIITRDDRIKWITPEAVQDELKKLFPMNRYTVVTLKPETSAAR